MDSSDKTYISDQCEHDALFAKQLAEEEAKQDAECESDAALALILQKQFDIDYNDDLKRKENRLNGNSKVGVSLENFRRDLYASDQDDDYESTLERNVEAEVAAWDAFEQPDFKRRSDLMGKLPYYTDEKGNIVTKHDIPTSSKKNVCRLMELKTDLETGDAGSSKDDFKINNKVYNSLKVHSEKSARRANQRALIKRESRKEQDGTEKLGDIQAIKMSDATRGILDGLLLSRHIEKLNGVIGHGKESAILHATGRDHLGRSGKEIAVKIFKSESTMAFKTRDTYNKSKCPAYKFDKPKSKDDSLNRWAKQGYKNLKKLMRAQINCPEPIGLRKHVLFMRFLGLDCQPAPTLKDANLSMLNLHKSYKEVVDIMFRMYNNCDLIHGDLSEYNLLWYTEQVFVIDVSQSMSRTHPNANSFLYRDCKNITNFYEKSGLIEMLDERALFKEVSGKDLNDKDVELLLKIEDFPCNERLMREDQDSLVEFDRADNFEHMLDSVEKRKLQREENEGQLE